METLMGSGSWALGRRWRLGDVYSRSWCLLCRMWTFYLVLGEVDRMNTISYDHLPPHVPPVMYNLLMRLCSYEGHRVVALP